MISERRPHAIDERQYQFGVDEATLRVAVAEVGITAGTVRAHLLERQ